MQDDLLSMLAGRCGHFRLESGHHGNLWLDLELLFLRPKAVQPLALELARRLAALRFDAVCGPLIEGAFVAQLVAAELDVEFAYAEPVPASGHPGLYPVRYHIPGPLRSRLRGRTVAVVNDVINAGSAVRGTFLGLHECGARPAAIGALLVLGDWSPRFAAENGIPLETLATHPNEIWSPDDCPMCADGQPLDGGFGSVDAE
jgi:orotate phosphoribosyltransferase